MLSLKKRWVSGPIPTSSPTVWLKQHRKTKKQITQSELTKDMTWLTTTFNSMRGKVISKSEGIIHINDGSVTRPPSLNVLSWSKIKRNTRFFPWIGFFSLYANKGTFFTRGNFSIAINSWPERSKKGIPAARNTPANKKCLCILIMFSIDLMWPYFIYI